MRQDHIGAEDGGDGAAHAGNVARALDDLLVNLLGHEQSLAFGADLGQERLDRGGLDLFDSQTVDNEDLAGSGLGAQRALEGQSLDLLVERVAVITRLRRKRDAVVISLDVASSL